MLKAITADTPNFFRELLFSILWFRCDKEETNNKYSQYMKEVEVDWDRINEKIEEEYRREREMRNSPNKAKKLARH